MIISSGNTLPPSTVIGKGGHAIPDSVVEDDAFALFDPQNDGLDFFESLESIRVQINNAVVVGPSDAAAGCGCLPTAVTSGPGPPTAVLWQRAMTRSRTSPARQCPLSGTGPPAGAGCGHFRVTDRIGVLDYRAANYELLIADPLPSTVEGQVTHEAASPAADAGQLRCGFHVGSWRQRKRCCFYAGATQIVEEPPRQTCYCLRVCRMIQAAPTTVSRRLPQRRPAGRSSAGCRRAGISVRADQS